MTGRVRFVLAASFGLALSSCAGGGHGCAAFNPEKINWDCLDYRGENGSVAQARPLKLGY